MNLDSTIRLYAEIGYAGDSLYPNQVEPMPENNVPSLKKRKKVMSDSSEEEMEEKKMPSDADKRKKYRKERIGKSASLQVW